MSRRLLCIVCASVLLLGTVVAPATGAPEGHTRGERPAAAVRPEVVASDPTPSTKTSTVGPSAITASATDDTFPGDGVNWYDNPFTDTLTATTDVNDYRRVHLEAGERYEFIMDPAAGLDFDLFLYGPGAEIWVAGSSGTGDMTEYISGTITTTGYYVVRVTQWAGSGGYQLYGSFASPDDNIFNDAGFTTPDMPGGATSGTWSDIYLDGFSEWDNVRRIWLDAGERIGLTLAIVGGSDPFEPRIYLYGPDATDIWADDYVAGNSGLAYPLLLNYTARTAGYHYVDIYMPYFESDRTYGNASLRWSVAPPILSPVYRFYNARLGTHFYTASEAEKDNVIATLGGTFTFEGPAYQMNTYANYQPLYRFYKPSTGTHFYTANDAEKASVIANLGHIYTFEGPAYNVSAVPVAGATTVWRFYNVRNGTHFYTANEGEKNTVQATLGSIYQLDGPAFWLAP